MTVGLVRDSVFDRRHFSISFVPVGGKTLGIQIAESGKARLLRLLFGDILGLMRLEVLSVEEVVQKLAPR